MKAQCTICSKIIDGKLMKYHLRLNHKTYMVNFGCAAISCGRTFNTLNSLNNHWYKNHTENNVRSEESVPEDIDFLPTIYEAASDEAAANSVANVVDYHEFKESYNTSEFLNTALKLASSLYGDMQLSRDQSNRIITQFDDILNGDFVNSLKDLVLNSVEKSVVDDVERRFYDLQSSFSHLNTEHKCFSELRRRDCLIDPQTITLGFREEPKCDVLHFAKNSATVIPLKKILKKFLELPEVFEKTIDYVNSLAIEKNISNIMQTEFWKIRSSVPNRDGIVLPIFLYEDDFESGNPLGSHATIYKMGAMYISLPCLPPRFRSQLDNIFLCQIVHSSDIDQFSDKQVYRNVIEQLNDLATTGIEIEIDDKKYNIFFQLALIVGDNLGLNRLLGFTTSFNVDYFCRFCKVSKKMSCKLNSENAYLLRKQENYIADVECDDFKKTGIKRNCVWNDVIGFHVTENFSVDIVHDLLEGVCNYDMGQILHHFVSERKLFTLASLNTKLKFFRYPASDCKPPLISMAQLKNQRLKMSAAEMKCFILNFSLIAGELVPCNNKYWRLYILLRQIVSIALQSSVSDGDIQKISNLIKQHHILYVRLFDATLKPKHHHMVHYPRIMRNIGPLRHTWTMRFEAKHRPLKQSAITSCNRINLPFTIAMKQQLNMSKIFFDRVGFKESSIYEELRDSTEFPIVQLDDPQKTQNYYQIKSYSKAGVKYVAKTVVRISVDDLPVFGRVKNIFRKRLNALSNDTDIAFIIRIFKSVKKDEHLQSFRLIDTNSHQFVELQSLPFFESRNMVILSNGNSYISYDYHLQ